MPAAYKAAIVGLGNIAWKFERGPGPDDPLTHAGALLADPRVELAGGFSPLAEERRAFQERLGVKAYGSLEELLSACDPHLVSICSPDEFHFPQAMQCLQAGAAMLWLEKPPAQDLEQVDWLISLQKEQGATVLVNFQRRYARCYQELGRICQEGQLGQLRYVNLTYSQGLATNGSHILDALDFILGLQAPLRLEAVMPGPGGQNPSFGLRRADGLAIWVAGAWLPYHNIDIALTFEHGRASVLYGGMGVAWESAVEHELYPGFFRLQPDQDHGLGPAGLAGAMSQALDDLIQAHQSARPPISSLASARRTMALIEQINQALVGGS